MPEYVLNTNAQRTGEREVHETTCQFAPQPRNRIPLGWHRDCFDAVAEARRVFVNVDGCKYCCRACHTR
ncbi:hypothetical protein GKC30_03180 [Pseudodesulfovibrio sp. F-1]|uniref:Uncharacterized protein n=1 Tax=Pseudodesulfovibrio alkaliphilus TaxID=2661613 RepID=A0A7K1KKM3_9BACT|nr:hypothetical protein [Pseudodesulfovibrio alkaliphilus]MUM76633.1 hypothetical protein [Pseudodesulfovibrio alkaliphilus]